MKEEKTITIKNNKKKNINEINSNNNLLFPTREQNYFQISENLYGSNEVVKVTFNNGGVHDGDSYIYDHDELYDNTIYHLTTLQCWEDFNYYVSGNNIPGWAMDTGIVKRIK